MDTNNGLPIETDCNGPSFHERKRRTTEYARI